MRLPVPAYTTETKLASQRLYLRPYTPEMAYTFWRLLRDNHTRLQPDFPDRSTTVASQADAERRIRTLVYQWNAGDSFSFGLWTIETETYVGDITLRRLAKHKPYAEVGYYLDASAEGKGYATEALEAVIQFAFKELRLERITLRCTQENKKSQLVAQRCGFTRSEIISIDFSNENFPQGRPLYTYRLASTEPPAQQP